MLISVIIPAFNDIENLTRCLKALTHQTYDNDYYEIIVVDNASSIPLKGVLEDLFPTVIFSYEAKIGPGAARNKGLSIAKGKIIAFIDSDCMADPNWLLRGLEYLGNHSDCDIAAGKVEMCVKDNAKPTIVELYDKIFYLRQDRYVNIYKAGATANLFVRSSVFHEIGVFDPALISGQDWELCLRARDRGYKIAYNEFAVIQHPARRTLQQFILVARRHAAGQILLRSRVIVCDRRTFMEKFLTWYIAIFVESKRMSILQKIGVAILDVYRYVLIYIETNRLKKGAAIRADGGFSRKDAAD